MSMKPPTCSGGKNKECPPPALTDKIIVNNQNNSGNLPQSELTLGIKPRPTMSKKMKMAQQIRNYSRR